MTKTNNVEPLDNSEWEVHSLDVGQASGNLVITPNGRSVLIDADKEKVVEALDEVMEDRTAGDGAALKTIDELVTTHIHADHVAGIRHLNDAGYSIEEAHQPNASRYEVEDKDGCVQPKVLEGYFEALEDNGIYPQDINQHTTGDEIFREGDTALNALSPPATDEDIKFKRRSTGRKCGYRPEKTNPNGLACKIESPEISCLFMGDMENDAANNGTSWLVAQHHDPDSEVDLDADIMIGPHHGSKHAMTPAVLDAVDPEQVGISSSLDNEYDHPHDETLEGLHEQDVGVYWTAGHGTIRTDLDEERITEQKTDLDTTVAADLAALKHYCGEHEIDPETVETLAPGNLPEETPEWITDAAPMIAKTPEEMVDAAITNAETVEEVRQTLEGSPAAAEHLRGVLQADRDDHVLSREDIEQNRQRYQEAKEAQDWEPTLSQRLRMKLPNQYVGMNPPYQDMPAPDEIKGPRSFGDIPEATTGKTAAEVRELGLYSPSRDLVEAEKTADTAVATAENTSEVCQELRQTPGAHKDFLYASETANAHEKEEDIEQEAAVQQGMSRSRDEDRGMSL